MRRFAPTFLLFASALTLAPTALANGRFPAAGQIAVDPSDPSHIIVRATYGILSTSDKGGRWDWICETAVGYGGFEDPSMGVTEDGSIIAGIFDGLVTSHDGGCGWTMDTDLASKFVVDVSVEKADPSKSVLLRSNGAENNTFTTQVWESLDNAKTWAVAGVDLPTDVVGVTLDVAPSDRSIMYVSGRKGAPDYVGVIERSTDRGASWEEFLIPGSDATHPPFLSAIDPKDPNILYVRLDGDPVDSLLVSKNGGESWTVAYESVGSLYAFALSPDGSQVVIGGDKDFVQSAPTNTLSFTKISDVGPQCFTWTNEGLYACASQFVDGFTVGVSTDGGKTFANLMNLADLCGPLDCPAGTEVGKECAATWPAVKTTIAATCGDEPDAGTSTSTGGAETTPEDTGCGCRMGDVDEGALPVGAATSVLLGLLFAARRNRSRRAP